MMQSSGDGQMHTLMAGSSLSFRKGAEIKHGKTLSCQLKIAGEVISPVPPQAHANCAEWVAACSHGFPRCQ
jgi:hypothetical protein